MSDTNMSDTKADLTSTKPVTPSEANPLRTVLMPSTDLYATEHGWTLAADVPGAVTDSLNVNVEQGTLTIEAASRLPDGGTLLHQEFEPVLYRRRFDLGDRVDMEHIRARLENGVLEVTLPKAKEAEPRKIEVKVQG
jgi:HSP20 family protein